MWIDVDQLRTISTTLTDFQVTSQDMYWNPSTILVFNCKLQSCSEWDGKNKTISDCIGSAF